MAKQLEYVSQVKFFPVNGNNSLAARGSFTVCDALGINFSLFKGQDGSLRLVLPNTINPKFNKDAPASKDNKKYFDEVRPISADRRTELETYILSEFEASQSGTTIVAGDDNIPF